MTERNNKGDQQRDTQAVETHDCMTSRHAPPPEGKAIVVPPSQPCTTVMRFSVSVPVLSLQMSVALPIVSHAASTRIRFWSFNILRVEYAREMVTASGCKTHKQHTSKPTAANTHSVESTTVSAAQGQSAEEW